MLLDFERQNFPMIKLAKLTAKTRGNSMKSNKLFYFGMIIAVAVLTGLSMLVIRSSIAAERAAAGVGEPEGLGLLPGMGMHDSAGDESAGLAEEESQDATLSPLAPAELSLRLGGGNDTAWMMLLLDEEGLTGFISATPATGAVPLNVQFSAVVEGGKPPYAYAWDLNGDGIQDDARQSFSYYFTSYGVYPVSLKVWDSDNSTVSASIKIYALAAPTVVASANPTSGAAPLEVKFNAIATDPDGKIKTYQWDFDGNGAYDHTSSTTPVTTHTYSKKGSYNATIQVTDSSGLKRTDAVRIEVGAAPEAKASANPKSGPAPLEVVFKASGTDSDGTIAFYEWDFDGDGNYDWKKVADGNTTHTYSSAGSYSVVLRVTDNNGLTGTDSVFISVGGVPVSLPRAYPISGDAPLKVTFLADGSDSDGTPYYFAWDFDGDGVYDKQLYTARNSTFTYTKAGTYNVTLKVTDNDGLSSTASLAITVTDPNPDGYPAAFASVAPTNGGKPLKVGLSGRGTDPDGFITKYEWDFNGDGTYEWQELARAAGPLGLLIDVGSYSTPCFGDVDGDGDLDLLVGNDNGTIIAFRNDGTKNAPLWTLVGPVPDATGARIKVWYNSAPALMDIDGDGDLELFVGEYYGTILYYRNTGSKTAPVWTAMGPLKDGGGNTIDVGYNSMPAFADINGDGLKDLLIGEYYGKVITYRNTGSKTAPVWTLVGPLTDAGGGTLSVGYNSAPAFVDIDGDGDLDLFVGEYYGTIQFYRNTGTQTVPVWTAVGAVTDSTGTGVDPGYSSAPTFADINGDGDLDLFIGEYYGGIYYYENAGNGSSPSFKLVSKKYDSVGVDSTAAPTLADIDGDGDLDLFVGAADGKISWYRNGGTVESPIWVSAGFLADATGTAIQVSGSSVPAFADIDGDGDLDLFIGESSGKVIYYQNTGSKTAPTWTLAGPVTDAGGGNAGVYYNAAPTFADLDGDGDLDLFIGDYYGTVVHYRNDGTGGSPKWTNMGALKDAGGSTINVGYGNRPAFADLDGDGNLDLLIGDYYGKLSHYKNTGDAHSPALTLVTSSHESINVQYNASPALADIDGDGDPDLFVGNYYGYIYFYPTLGFTTHLYQNAGTYHPTLRVTDNSGLTATASVEVRVLSAGSPTAYAKAEPTAGTVPLLVNFGGSGVDPNGTIAKYEWDFNGDGTYDWNSASSPATTYTYNKVGTFNATLRVTDNDGKTATASIPITTTLGITVTRTGIFNPSSGEKATVCNSYTDSAKVTVKIIDGAGNLVKTLASNVSRDKGTTYCDEWNGQNAAGKSAPDGVYYYLIEYTVNGQKFTHDLRKTSEFKETAPWCSWSGTFNPYQNKFVEVTYPTSKPSEIGLQFWTWDCSVADCVKLVRTIYTREPVGQGTQTALWDGVDDRGVAVKDGDYPLRLWVYELPDNAIIITGNRPVITGLSASPNYYATGYNPYRSGTGPQPTVSFTLSEAADVEVRIANALGVVVKTMNKVGLPAGTNTIIWDGKDQSGNPVLPGSYTIRLTAVDAGGNRSLSRYGAVVLSE